MNLNRSEMKRMMIMTKMKSMIQTPARRNQMNLAHTKIQMMNTEKKEMRMEPRMNSQTATIQKMRNTNKMTWAVTRQAMMMMTWKVTRQAMMSIMKVRRLAMMMEQMNTQTLVVCVLMRIGNCYTEVLYLEGTSSKKWIGHLLQK